MHMALSRTAAAIVQFTYGTPQSTVDAEDQGGASKTVS
jgi:hypothetical protein